MDSSDTLAARNTTFFWDRVRAISTGIVEAGASTFYLYIAISVFDAGPAAKSLIAAAIPAGLLLSPVLVNFSANRGWRPAPTAAVAVLTGSSAIILALVYQLLPVYLFSVICFAAANSVVVPLLTQIYQDNYDETERGRLFTWAAMIRIITAGAFGAVGGWILDWNLGNWVYLMLIFLGAAVLAGFSISHFPSKRRAVPKRANPFHALIYLKTDAVFRKVLIAQMMMGIGMMMAIPLRIEYLADEKYGLVLAPSLVAFLTTTLPSGSRLVFSPVWGRLFDRVNFFALRITLNVISVASLIIFFYSTSIPMLMLGMIIFGIFRAGGEVAWNLWVTKIAPPELVADYMSVHTLLTGVRGIFAPFLGFYAATVLPLQSIASISGCLLLGACLLLFPELRKSRDHQPGKVLVRNMGTRQ